MLHLFLSYSAEFCSLLFMKYIDQISLNTVHDDIMCIYKPACYIVINAVLGCKKSRSNSIQSH